jgi:class 3 adenylate cyclase
VDLREWLRDLGLEQYADSFIENEIGEDTLPRLTVEDLKDLGVTLVGHRRKLLDAFAALSSAQGAAAVSEVIEDSAVGTAIRPVEAERRQLTVVFCDLVGSTDLARRLDPEDMSGVIRAYQACCADAVNHWEGQVAKYMGDGVLAYFGWPAAHEDDAERAVRAGLELVERVACLEAGSDAPLAARVGIATGQVVVGDLIGEGAAQERTVVGETPNLAARLQALAEPGAVVIAPSTRRLLGGLFELEELGACALKGFAEPVPAFRVASELRGESRFEALYGRPLMPLAGRDEELLLLASRWHRAKEGESQVVLLAGEPGIGNSRLCDALSQQVGDEPHARLRYQCSPYHRHSALYPVISRLESTAGFRRDDDAGTKLTKLETLLAREVEHVSSVAPLFATLLAIPVDGRYPPLNLTPQQLKAKTLHALAAQLETVTARQPVLLVFEDLHWADPTSLEFLGLVLERTQNLPVLAIFTFRPEFIPPWTGRAHTTQLSLSPLTRGHGTAVVERVAGGKPLPAEVNEQILTRTDGVPLFIEELTKTVLESGLLEDAGERYVLRGPLPPLAIPATLHDSLMARLDRLGPVKRVAQVAACIGREFSHELLAAVSSLQDDRLEEARKAG